ncbi:MAG TPA: cell division protein FtsZ [Polyangiaceae bacterium]|nr:cell division protein FtsZ [Polyangiaceae bacterium]
MSFSIEFADEMSAYNARIKVIGCGGSGGNAINTMMHFGLEGVEFIAVNTDAQALNANAAPVKIPIGSAVTKGLGAGADPERGRKAALEDVTRLKEAITGADMVFVTAGMGGGTGTGAAPIVAQLAREEGALTVGVVTKPFIFEGRKRARHAEQGLAVLSEHVDTLITIPNEKLITLADEEMTFVEAFRKADEVLYQAIKGISDLITQEGIVNVDFADVRAVMSSMGRALMGTGCAKGDGRARLAAQEAITSPLLDDISVDGATGVLINIVGGPDMKMREIQEAATLVQEQAHEDANIIFGATVDESMADMLKVTVIATGFDRQNEEHAHLMKQASRQPMEREAAPQTRASHSMQHPHAHGHHSHAPEMAFASRRPAPSSAMHAHSSAPPASGLGSAQLPQLRERITFPSQSSQASMDHEWDIPTFQRRSGG